ncbi:MAG: hypothetical protein QOE58_583, partial [Actinomycetota bacterium]|nr:hypothetical protein [Actinomycetota bacterium]
MNGSRPVASPSGWYVDPAGRAELRFWTGQEWARWVWDGATVAADPHPIRRPLNSSDLGHLEFIDNVFLPEIRATGQITHSDDNRLKALLRRLTAEAESVVAPPGAEAAGPAPTPGALPQPTASAWRSGWTAQAQTPHPAFPSVASGVGAAVTPTARIQDPRTAPEQVKRSPDSAFSRWWTRTVQSVGTDLAVHGIAYLGVLLFFVGVFGLVVFAFGDVTAGLRPLAELFIALAPFVAGALLRRRRAVTVGRALEVLGGVLLPIMILTSFVDGVAFPPDVHGILLVVVLTVLTALIAASFAWWSTKHERSALRYLIAPIAWLAVATTTLGLGRAIPVGKDVAIPSAAQVAAVVTALVVTLAWARLRPQARFAGPTLSVAGPGLFVVALLAVLTWQAQGWPTAPVLISGVMVLTALELLRDRLPVAVLGLAEPLWWALVWPSLVASIGVAPAGAAAAIGFV